MKTKTFVIILVVVFGGLFAYKYFGNQSVQYTSTDATSAPHETTNLNPSNETADAKNGAQATTGSNKAATGSLYTLAQVATHNKRSDCWTAINKGVYNVTSWIDRHPGGAEAILSLCGKDGSAAFNDQHGGQRRPEQELATFKIGVLK